MRPLWGCENGFVGGRASGTQQKPRLSRWCCLPALMRLSNCGHWSALPHKVRVVDMKLIPNAKQVLLHSYSQRAQGAALAMIGGYSVMPDKWQDSLPMPWVMGMACLALVLGIVGRLIAQPDLAPPTEGGQ